MTTYKIEKVGTGTITQLYFINANSMDEAEKLLEEDIVDPYDIWFDWDTWKTVITEENNV